MRYLLTAFLILAIVCIASAGKIDKTWNLKAPAQSMNADLNQQLNLPEVPYIEPEPMDPVQVGTTWYDWMNYGSLSKTIVVDNSGNIHLAWTNGLNNGSTQRHIYYNCKTSVGSIWAFPNGTMVFNQTLKSGFSTIDVMSDGRAVVCAHANVPQSMYYGYPSIVGVDYMPCVGAFYPQTPIPSPAGCDTCIWPHMAVDIDDNIHVFGRRYTTPNEADYNLIYYSSSVDQGFTFSQYAFADTVNVPSFTVATSRISERAAFGYHQALEDYNFHPQWGGFLANQLSNDAYIILKEDGQNWDWANPINITQILKGDATLLPDTLQAQGDTLRAYSDIDLLFDDDDVLHAMFTSRGLWEAPWDTTSPPISGMTAEASVIWHWREDTEELSVVAWGWWSTYSGWEVEGGVGSWNSSVCRPSMGIDDEGNIYCTFEYYKDWTVTPDTSQSGFANGDVMVTVSMDGGSNWAQPTNITNTISNGAPAGQCMSECFPCLAEEVDDSLHIFYMLDKNAGSSIWAGSATLNPMNYQAVYAASIPTTPVVEQIPFHIRPLLALSVEPAVTPIIIPAGGGSFQFEIGVENYDNSAALFSVWTNVTLPNGSIYGPIILRTTTGLSAGEIVIRNINQNVPARAPSGSYIYNAYIGIYPNTIYGHKTFNFSKSGVIDNAVGGWEVSGWQNESIASLTVLPSDFGIQSAYPNPFNNSTTITFDLPESGEVSLKVYDISGREITTLDTGHLTLGTHSVVWDAEGQASGVYFVRLVQGGNESVRKVVLMK